MVQFIFSHLWHSLLGWVGITGVILIGAIIVYVKVPVPSVRHLAVSVASACLCILFLYPKGYFDGSSYVKAQWKKQEDAARAAGNKARADAIADAARGVRDSFDDDDPN